MNINILYMFDKTGKKLLESLQDEFEEVTYNEILIEGITYIDVKIHDKNSELIRLLNSPRAIKNCTNAECISSVLNLNRISYGNLSNETINKTFEVTVFDLQTAFIRMKNHNKPGEKFKYIKEPANSKIVEAAKKTVHLLGLDFGTVTIALTAKRKIKVTKINPSPVLREKDITTLIKKIRKVYFYENTDIKLGADPEFMMVNAKTGKMVSASQFFPREGVIGCDNIRVPNRQQRPVAEIRPRPNTSPIELMTNIKQALGTASRIAPYRNVKWVAGSQPIPGYSIGGHVHFSNIELNAAILRALDNYLGIPVFLIENAETAIRRRRKYGYLGDYRLKDYGGFEYRTPGSWLVSQEIATAVICLAKIVTSRYIYLSKNYLNNIAAQKSFYTGNQEYFRAVFPAIWAEIQKLDIYVTYARELEIIPRMVMEHICWDEKTDFRKAWIISGSAKKKPTTKKQSSNTNTSSDNNNSEQTTVSPPETRRRSTNRPSRSGRSTNQVRTVSNRNVSINNVSTQAHTSGYNTISIDRRVNNSASGRIINSGQVRTSVIIR